MCRIHGVRPGAARYGSTRCCSTRTRDDRERLRGIIELRAQRAGTPARDRRERRVPPRARGRLRPPRPPALPGRARRARSGGLVGSAQDVTEPRLAESELQAHYAIGQTLREWESFDEGVIDLLRRLGTALDYPIGTLWTDGGAGKRIEVRALLGRARRRTGRLRGGHRSLSLAPGMGVPGRVWATGEAVVVEDVQAGFLPARRRAAADIGLRSAVAFPAAGEGDPLAVLTFYSFDRRVPSERLLRTLGGIGAELGRFLHTRRGELGDGRLTPRELDVLRLAAEGKSGPKIAAELIVSPSTVKTHFEHIYEKLGVADRARGRRPRAAHRPDPLNPPIGR